MTRPITDELRKRFADEQGYLWCGGCDKQLPATLFCESCNDYAWNNDIARTLAKKDMAVLDWCERIAWDISDDRKSGRFAA